MWGWAKVAYVDQRELWRAADPGLSSLITLFTAAFARHPQIMKTNLIMMMLMEVMMLWRRVMMREEETLRCKTRTTHSASDERRSQ